MYQFKSAATLLRLCGKHRKPISEIAINYEKEHGGKSRTDVVNKMRKVKDAMFDAIQKGIHSREHSFLNLAGGDASKIYQTFKKRRQKMLNSVIVLRAMAYATATGETNACMGRIVAFPTAGGSGVVPGVIFSYAKQFQITEAKHLAGLFAAAAIGLIIAENATLSAAAGGCQAEIGSSIAMAAAAVTEMRGGAPEQCLNAAALGLKSYLGVVCDPLGGLVAIPCIKRNALGAALAMSASDLSMAGVKSYIPFDEVVRAMGRVGKTMSTTLKETALGGLAVTPTGLKVREKLGLPSLKPLDTPDEQPKPLEKTKKPIQWKK